SIPGAHAYGEVFPAHVTIETPGPKRIGTPSRIGTPDHIGPFGIPSVSIDIPHVSVDNPLQVQIDVTTPLPAGNISNRDDRWGLVSTDTLPAYQHLLATDPNRARAIVASPVEQRVDEHRLSHQLDEILARMTRWSVDVRQ